MAWEAHGRRRNPAYEELRSRVSRIISASIPSGSVVLVVSRGDELLVDLPDHEGWHFPGSGNGKYAGHHAADDGAAIAELERTRSRGATYLVVPSSGLWWLDYYKGFRLHLESRYQRVGTDAETAVIYDLHGDGKG